MNEMGEGESSKFLEWYKKQDTPFENRRVLNQYCQDNLPVLRQAC